VLAEIARQSGIPTKIDNWADTEKEAAKLPLTIKFSNAPYWEAVAEVSRRARLGITHDTNEVGEVHITGCNAPVSQCSQFGPVTVGLVDSAFPGGFALRLLYLDDEAQTEGKETYFFTENGVCGGWPIKIRCGQQEKEVRAQRGSLDCFSFTVPPEFCGKAVTVSGGFSYSIKQPVGKMTIKLEKGAVGQLEDVCVSVTDIVPNGDLQAGPIGFTRSATNMHGDTINFVTTWDTGLPKETLDESEKVISDISSWGNDEALRLADVVKQKSRRIVVHLDGIVDGAANKVSGGDPLCSIHDFGIRGGGSVMMHGSAEGCSMVLKISRIEPGSIKRAEFKFENVILGKN
jgi:hypothetical protein